VTGTGSYTWAGTPSKTYPFTEQVTVAQPVQAPYRNLLLGHRHVRCIRTVRQAVRDRRWWRRPIYRRRRLQQHLPARRRRDHRDRHDRGDLAAEHDRVRQGRDHGAQRHHRLGSTPEGVILFESPLGRDPARMGQHGGTNIDAVTPPNGTIPESLPVYLSSSATAMSTTGYYSYDGQDWLSVGRATVHRPGRHPGRRDVPDLPRQRVGGGGTSSTASMWPAVPPRRPLPPRTRPSRPRTRCRRCRGGKLSGLLGREQGWLRRLRRHH